MTINSDQSETSAAQISSRKSLVLPEAATSQSLPQSLIFFISNIKSLIPIKLDSSNFLVWRTLIENALKANYLLEFVEGKIECPDSITDNEAFLEWVAINAQLMSCVLATIHHSILPLVKNATTVHEIWKILLKRFAQFSRSQIHTLQHQLHILNKGSKSMAEYVEEIQQILDQLSLSSVIIDDEQLIILVLEGLSKLPAYDNISSQIRNSSNQISIDQVFSMLISEEIHVLRSHKLRESPSEVTVAFQTTHHTQSDNKTSFRGNSRGNFRGSYRGNQGGNRGNYRGNGRSSSFRNPNRQYTSNGSFNGGHECQICGKLGHTARTCWFRFTNSTPANSASVSNQALSVMDESSQPNSFSNSDWYLDTGASHHVTHDLQNLTVNNEYSGGDQVFVGNGAPLSVQNSGKGQTFGSNSSQRL